MTSLAYLHDVVVFLVATVIVVPLFERLRASPLVGYLVAGTVVGPAGLGVVSDVAGVRAVAELGIVVLLFSIGLELTLERLKVIGARVVAIGLVQMGATAVGAAAVALAAGMNFAGAVVVGAAIALSSTSVVLQLLVERHELATRVGRTAFAILLLQDLALGPTLVLIPALGEAEGAVFTALGTAALKAALILVVLLAAGRLVLRPLYRMVAGGHSPELFTALNLLTIIATGLASHLAGLSMALGALLAGILLAETEYRLRVEEDIKPFQGLLMGLFFMSVGMFVDVRLALDHAGMVLLLAASVVTGKTLVLMLAARAFGLGLTASLRLGLLLAQGDAFAFIFLGQAERHGLMASETARLLMVAVALTMAVTPFLVTLSGYLNRRMEPTEAPGLTELASAADSRYDHAVILGFGLVGSAVATRFLKRGLFCLVIEADRRKVIDGRARGLPVFQADASQPETLAAAHGERASAIVVALGRDPGVRDLVAALRGRHPELRILARAHDEHEGRELIRAGATEVVVEAQDAADRLASALVVPVEE